jgi:hypothetical protein
MSYNLTSVVQSNRQRTHLKSKDQFMLLRNRGLGLKLLASILVLLAMMACKPSPDSAPKPDKPDLPRPQTNPN